VAAAAGDLTTLRLLDALTEADSIATSTAAWGSWKEELVGVLVARTAHVLGGGELADVPSATFPNATHLALLAQRRRIIEGIDDRLTVVSPDRPGMFSRVAGVLSLHGLQVLEAAVHTDDAGMAVEAFRVDSSFGSTIVWDRVVRDLERALDGRIALEARLADRARVYARPRRLPGLITHPEVIVDNDLSHTATVLEVHAPDAMGVLWRITRALHELDLDVTSAKIQTMGTDAVDSFYVRDAEGHKVTEQAYLDEVERALLFALGDAP
jgi:[protein-PII] uridylyltransferase